jgi:hypothetical protein
MGKAGGRKSSKNVNFRNERSEVGDSLLGGTSEAFGEAVELHLIKEP